ncbi:hypothetical protein NLI96_g6076 [Meripilus lineatus]|uniref:Uncharacterized protein n=1 Tax=Meripilus lineatus TaxID=2056292 RepID=A0AAD5V418_9APHY|nr:hypothetical protein NLI96_g6076 [Physisporinus lineatus]
MPFCTPCYRSFPNNHALQEHGETSTAHYDDSDSDHDSLNEEIRYSEEYKARNLFCGGCQVTWDTWFSFRRHLAGNRDDPHHAEFIALVGEPEDEDYFYSEGHQFLHLFCGGCQVTWDTWPSFRAHVASNCDDPHHAEFIERVRLPEYEGLGYSEEYKFWHLFCEPCQWIILHRATKNPIAIGAEGSSGTNATWTPTFVHRSMQMLFSSVQGRAAAADSSLKPLPSIIVNQALVVLG